MQHRHAVQPMAAHSYLITAMETWQRQLLRVAHVSRVPGEAVSGSRTFATVSITRKACFGGTPKPTRETRALPG